MRSCTPSTTASTRRRRGRRSRDAASEFRRILESEDYALLARIDSSPETPPYSERARVLLYNLALLEYNDFYCRSHPVIRTTNAYRAARGALENVGTG